jgi:nitrogen-specific signal transduction histidine kinase
MTFEQQWIEYDYNPFILFNSEGKILSLNAEAQYLMGATDASTIYEIAMSYASSSFGFNTTFVDLEFGRFKYFGVTVGYETEEEIGIRLYQTPTFKFTKPQTDVDLVNIYTLIDLAISSNSIGNTTEFVKDLDPTIPEIRLNANLFIKMLNKIYASMLHNDNIKTRLFFRIGEYIRFEGEKYTIFAIEVSGESIEQKHLPGIEALVNESNLYVDMKESSITVNIPMIMS